MTIQQRRLKIARENDHHICRITDGSNRPRDDDSNIDSDIASNYESGHEDIIERTKSNEVDME